MKKLITSLLLCVFLFSSIHPVMGDELDKLNKETDKLWRPGAGAEDGAFTASAMSMLGWGLGLAAVITLLAILIESSETASSAHAHCH
jgi:hypothetical protein